MQKNVRAHADPVDAANVYLCEEKNTLLCVAIKKITTDQSMKYKRFLRRTRFKKDYAFRNNVSDKTMAASDDNKNKKNFHKKKNIKIFLLPLIHRTY